MTVKEIIAQALGVPLEQIRDDLAIGDIPQWSSMANMSIISSIEKTLDIEIPIDDLFEMTSVAAIEAEVRKVKNGQS